MKHHRLPVALPTLLAFLLLTGATARGQVEALDPHDASLHSQLQRLNDNIERIATLLEQSLDGQQLDLLIQRVEMGANRLAVAERNLRSAQDTRTVIDNEKLEIEARLTQMADDLDRGAIDMPLEEMEQYTRALDLRLQLLKERLRDADREIIELENEVMRQRGSIRDWQDYIDDELTSRQ
jgi:chromosome segregation ATPase